MVRVVICFLVLLLVVMAVVYYPRDRVQKMSVGGGNCVQIVEDIALLSRQLREVSERIADARLAQFRSSGQASLTEEVVRARLDYFTTVEELATGSEPEIPTRRRLDVARSLLSQRRRLGDNVPIQVNVPELSDLYNMSYVELELEIDRMKAYLDNLESMVRSHPQVLTAHERLVDAVDLLRKTRETGSESVEIEELLGRKLFLSNAIEGRTALMPSCRGQ